MISRMTQCASAVRKLGEAFCEQIEDARRFYAPSECYGVIINGQVEKLQETLEAHGYKDGEEFFDELQKRTTPKFAFFNFGWVL